jgi:hypothetical protein
LEELLPKDNESIHLPFDGPLTPSEPAGFSADLMIRCDECLRANPPTRVNCLYCGTALPLSESTAQLRQPTLRRPEKHEIGYNTIALPNERILASNLALEESAKLVKLDPETCKRIVGTGIPLPLARTASRDEADLVCDRLKDIGLSSVTLSDETLGFGEDNLIRVRAMQWDEETLTIFQSGLKDVSEISWSDLRLAVSGRLVLKKVEVVERKSRRSENELLDASQFFVDEAVFDLHCSTLTQTLRVGANSFDFSCLREEKTLVAGQNLKRLYESIIGRSANIHVDDLYTNVRPLLEVVWPTEQETQSRGWRRERPGKISLGAETINSNESQFTRYSRLRRYFFLN